MTEKQFENLENEYLKLKKIILAPRCIVCQNQTLGTCRKYGKIPENKYCVEVKCPHFMHDEMGIKEWDIPF